MAKPIIKRKGKRAWYRIIAPDVFQNKELDEVLAYEPEELVGRHVRYNYSRLTNHPRDKNKSFVLKITDVVEKQARTEPINIVYSNALIGRTSRRNKTRVLHVGKYKTKDGKELTVKLYLLATKNIVRSVKTNLKKQTDMLLETKFKKIESKRVFEPNYLESLSKELKSKVKTVYPVGKVMFWKVNVE